MITERKLARSESHRSTDDTVKIIDEMDRLLNEMQETMGLIKRILGDGDRASVSPFPNKASTRTIENILQSS